MLRREFVAKMEKAKLKLSKNHCDGVCIALCKSFKLHNDWELCPVTKEFKTLLHPYKTASGRIYWLELWDQTVKQDKILRLNALEIFNRICLTEKLYKEW